MVNTKHTRVLIIEDNINDVEELKRSLASYQHIEIVGVCRTGKEGLSAIQALKPNVVFLDIELPDMKGLDIIESLDANTLSNCQFVIYTAFIDYMLESFRNHAFDFLLKPIKSEDLDSIIRRLQTTKVPQRSKDGKIYLANGNLLMFINSMDFRVVRIRDIVLFQYNNEIRVWEAIIANTQKPVRLKRNITNKMLVSLDEQFVQVNQKYIININYLFQVTDNLCSFYPPHNDINYVKVGSSFRRQLMERFLCL